MINEIKMKNVNCFKDMTELRTDKRTNLIYGLNGTGKSTLSGYLYNPSDIKYEDCSISGLNDQEVLVYNQAFIRDYFYETDALRCIFTLSRENKEAQEAIRQIQIELGRVEALMENKKMDFVRIQEIRDHNRKKIETYVWEIKTEYTGGDRVLEYCLDKLKSKKEVLFKHLLNVEKPKIQPQYNVEQLKTEVEALSESNELDYSLLPFIDAEIVKVENDPTLQTVIVGNENSIVSSLIVKLNNSDWVKEGLPYISDDSENNASICPFCQERTITEKLRNGLQMYFDKTYEDAIGRLKALLLKYQQLIEVFPKEEVYLSNPFVMEKRQLFNNLYRRIIFLTDKNKGMLSEKLKTPSQLIQLQDSSSAIADFNKFIVDINAEITVHKTKILNRVKSLEDIRKRFWSLMRWQYDRDITLFLDSDKGHISEQNAIVEEINGLSGKSEVLRRRTRKLQENTVNIEEARENINQGLIELGIDEFRLERHTDASYQIVRNSECNNTFISLSEGEKMIISFLYFRELCKGLRSSSSDSKRRIVVIDDPISSLSHIYVFNIGRMIKIDFLDSPNFEQVFILTHSLYFFYEMTIIDRDERKKKQNLFRLRRNTKGTQILEMHYEEIQNDYQAYWSIIKDENQRPALIANCMRNIIEYFFGFIEKLSANNVFQKRGLQDTKYQAFCRYINRESHSFGQNVYDLKEFDYNDFKEAFRLVFVESGYEEHYRKMMQV